MARNPPLPNPYLHGNFAPVFVERSEDHDLPVTGLVPPTLTGRLLRNGPNPAVVPVDESAYHWFGGDGMIHAVSLADGKAVGYRNRWVRTVPWPPGSAPPHHGDRWSQSTGRPTPTSSGMAPPPWPFRTLASPTPWPMTSVGPGSTTSTVGWPLPWGPTPRSTRRPASWSSSASMYSARRSCAYHTVDPLGAVVHSEPVGLARATLSHDFGLTASRVVVLDLPVVVDVALTPSGRGLTYRWVPEGGARVGVVPRTGTATGVRWVGIEPAFVLHVLNCYDDGDAVVMDVVRYDRAFDTGPGEAIASCLPALARWTIDPSAGRVTERRLDDVPVEFPRIDDTVAGTRHRYGYCARLTDRAEDPTPLGLVKYDLQRDESIRFEPGPHRFCSEPVFVRAVDGRGEDEGWILSLVYDATRDASDLVILDATSFAGPPVATVQLPVRVPFGFHGSWVPADS